LRIAEIRASVHRLETRLPLVDKPAGDSTRVVCRVETDDGLVGIGMAARFLAHGVAACINHHIAPALKGMEVQRLEAIHARLHPLISERGRMSGINLAASSAVDLALWDLLGKRAGCSVAELLGGYRKEAEVYVTFGFGVYDKDQLVEVAQDLIANGHSRLKMLVGVAGVRGDAERVRHVRDAVGPGILLAVDANEGVTLDYAVKLARLIEDFDVAWFEDPVAANDARDLAALRRQTSIPLSAGQMDGHSARFRELVEHDAIDIFMPNSLYNGGMSETRRVAHLSQIYNRPLSDAGGGGIYCLHHVAGFRNATLAECHLGVTQVERQLFRDAPEPSNGVISVPDAPGFGVQLNEEVVKETLLIA
jgi:L-rhamnonate dehydratase